MADRKLQSIDVGTPADGPGFHTNRTAAGETRLGTDSPGTQGGFYVMTGNSAARLLNNGQTIPAKCPNLGSWFAMDSVDASGVATTWYFFVTTAGVLKVSNTVPTDTNSDGAVV